MKYFLKIILSTISIVAAIQITNAQKRLNRQPKLTGYVYQSDGNTIPFSYKVLYKTDTTGGYTTQYKVFIDGVYKFDVLGTHKKSERKIEVEVDRAGGGVFAAVAEAQTTNYKTTTLTAFGYGGVGSVIGGNRIPNQLAVKFLSSNFTYIKVINVLGYHGDDGADYFVFR